MFKSWIYYFKIQLTGPAGILDERERKRQERVLHILNTTEIEMGGTARDTGLKDVVPELIF